MVIFILKSSRMHKKALKDLEGSQMFYKFYRRFDIVREGSRRFQKVLEGSWKT